MAHDATQNVATALDQIPSGMYIMTAASDGLTSGILVRWVQRCCIDPPMLMLALRKGMPIEPIIRDSRSFALCQIDEKDRFLHRKFATPPDRTEDPFVGLPTQRAPGGSPIIERAMAWLECELVRNVELDCDHRLYVGQVICGKRLHDARPAIHFGLNGTDRSGTGTNSKP